MLWCPAVGMTRRLVAAEEVETSTEGENKTGETESACRGEEGLRSLYGWSNATVQFIAGGLRRGPRDCYRVARGWHEGEHMRVMPWWSYEQGIGRAIVLGIVLGVAWAFGVWLVL